ncbi:hypothetical protein OPIT5_00830 [Opitutaceae bacterium TAV5]|nr:hypothetical protein OPIT5_00830 [Opitutaceae bacterium TAV5]
MHPSFSILKIVTLCLVCAASSPAALPAGDAAGTLDIGPLALQPAAAVYIVKQGAAINARVTAHRGSRAEGERLLVRAFGPDERISFWQYCEPGRKPVSFGPGDGEVWGIPLPQPAKPRPGEMIFDADIPLVADGVHQIRLVGGARNSTARVSLPPGTAWGISCQNGTWSPWEGQPEKMFVYIPPRAEELQIGGGPLRILDETGKQIAESTIDNLRTLTTIPVTRTDVVWQVEFPSPDNWRIRASAGFPFILCSSPDAARAIKASVEILPDGTVVAWKFQRRIAELLPALLSPENVGKADDLIVPLASREAEWLKNPERNVHLLDNYGLFSTVAWSLRHQNVDPASHWAGAINGWQERIGRPAPENRWDRLRSLPGLWAGITPRNGSMAENLAEAALLDAPFNPWSGRKELLYRATAAALSDLLALTESEVWPGVEADLDPYPGFMAFPVAQKTFPVYGLAAPRMPPEVRDVWTEGLRHIVDRMFAEQLVTTRNQSSHFPLAWQIFANGSGDPRYAEIARAEARRFIEGQSPAGYHMEATGPDGSYIGMTHWHLAMYYRQSGGDPAMLESLRRSYRFFNHTVAPEPDGTMLGGFNFNHRVGDGFFNEQWGGARGILDDVLPESAIWTTTAAWKRRAASRVEALPRTLQRDLEPNYLALGNLETPRYLYWTDKPDLGVTWPACESRSFIRNFADELIAVKRPGYYATVYVGRPATDKHYIRNRERFRRPLPDDAENRGGEPQPRQITPFLGGGLSSFSTPAYGHAVLATNWTPLAHHGLVATKADGTRWWEDYFGTAFTLDERASSLSVTGKVEGLPLSYERRYLFRDNQVEIMLTLKAGADLSLETLVENIPVPLGAAKPNGATLRLLSAASADAAGASVAQGFVVTDNTGGGVEFVLDQPRRVVLRPDGLQRRGLQIGRAEISLPVVFRKGESVTLSCTIRSLRESSR